jgi:hypothetical protein
MTQLDRIISDIDAIEDGLTLKADYTDEKARLDNIYSDLSVMATMGAPRWKVNDAKNRIRHITDWMDEEEAAALR